MAELAKMLHFLKSGTEQTAKAYSTVDEAGDNYVPLKIDGVACYAPLGATDDAMATNGRVIKGGTTYAIKSQAKPPYTEISYTTAGTHTFTVPAGITRLRVAVCGGGGGAATIQEEGDDSVTKQGGSGGTSYFGSTSTLQATGGGGGYVKGTKSTTALGKPTVKWSKTAGTAGSPSGREGATAEGNNTTASGGAGFALAFTNTSGSYGQGGGATVAISFNSGYKSASSGGGSGGYNTGYITVTSGTTYTVVVGAAGTSEQWTNGTSGESPTITQAKSGFVFIAYGGDI